MSQLALPHIAESRAADGTKEVPPPSLRQDLKLHSSAAFADGSPAWAIQDPVTNRFYRIGWLEYECLIRWHLPLSQMAAEINACTTLEADAQEMQEFVQFLDRNNLLHATPQKIKKLQQQSGQKRWRSAKWWLHTYLFVRVPLVRPQRLLNALLPVVEPLFSWLALWLLLTGTALGLILVARQWDTFIHSFADMLSPAGLAGFALALIVSKTMHEMGHALVATRLGVRVAHMGVAFVVLWPMLYTDTSESWRLPSHRQRLAISIAGVSMELALAGIATLAWALLDDGLLRQAMLYLATTGWVLSLALNVSPFMRFDGYFILSDILNFPNLHERSSAMARAFMRRTLLGLNDPYPEPFKPAVAQRLRLFAFLTWFYRLVIFLGIALMVYHFFFKALGIFLLIVELWWFVAKPIWTELMVWKKRWPEVPTRKRAMWWGGALLLLLLLAFPWSGQVSAYGAARAQRQQVIYSPQAAKVLDLLTSGRVQAGQSLALLDAPSLHARKNRTQASVQALSRQLPALMDMATGLDVQQATMRRLQEQLAEAQAIDAEVARLLLIADFSGLWLDVDPHIRSGTWVDPRIPLGVLVDSEGWLVDAYVSQQEIERIQMGAAAKFWPQGWLSPLAATVVDIDGARTQQLAYPMLDGRFGGNIATQLHQDKALLVYPMYRVRLQLHEPVPQVRELPGAVHIEAAASSWLGGALQSALAVLIRESGF